MCAVGFNIRIRIYVSGKSSYLLKIFVSGLFSYEYPNTIRYCSSVRVFCKKIFDIRYPDNYKFEYPFSPSVQLWMDKRDKNGQRRHKLRRSTRKKFFANILSKWLTFISPNPNSWHRLRHFIVHCFLHFSRFSLLLHCKLFDFYLNGLTFEKLKR